MVSKAREIIFSLFNKDNAKLWCVCYPAVRSPSTGASVSSGAHVHAKKGNTKLQGKEAALIKPYSEPPSAKQFQRYLIEDLDADKKGLFLQVIDHIKQGFLDMFSNGKGVLHNTAFWSQYFQYLVFELSAGLVVHSGPSRNEAEVRHELLTPLLNRAAHCSSIMKALGDFKGSEVEYSSEFNFEMKTDSSGTPGWDPEVDHLLSGYVGNEAVYRIPAESKVKMEPADMSQLSQYMSTMTNGKYISSNVTQGILLDETLVQFAFSALCLDKEGKCIPLPIVLLSPPLKWRERTALDRGVCIGICLLHSLQMKRKSVCDQWQKSFGQPTWDDIIQFATMIYDKKIEVNHSRREFPYDAHQELEKLRQEVNQLQQNLRREVKEVEELKQNLRRDVQEVKELQQRVEGLSNAKVSS